MLINYELLRTLLVAGTAPTFAEAAARRHVTPSAISQQIKALEGQLGVPLFERVGRRARLTPAGARLVAVLRQEFSTIDDAVDSVAEDHAIVRGAVVVGGPAPFARIWLRPRIATLLHAYPELQIEARFAVPSVLTRQLIEGQCDLAVLVSAVDAPSLETQPIYVEEFEAVASPGYVKKHGAPELARDLASHRFIVFDADLAMHAAWWRARFGAKEPLPPRVVCRIASLDEMLALAKDGIGIAVLPNYFVADALAAKEVVIVAPASSKRRGAKNPIFLAWRKASVESARFRVVREALLSSPGRSD